MTSHIWDMTSSSNFFDKILSLLSSLVTSPSFMSISSLVFELLQFPFKKDWSEIRKSEIALSEFCPVSADWDELGIPPLGRTSLIKCYWRETLLRGNQQDGGGGGGVKLSPPSTNPDIRLKDIIIYICFQNCIRHSTGSRFIIAAPKCFVKLSSMSLLSILRLLLEKNKVCYGKGTFFSLWCWNL